MADKDLWIQITAESDDIEDSAPVDVAAVKTLINAHNTSDNAHADIRAQLQAIADTQTQEIKEYESKRKFPTSGDTSVTIYIDVSTGNLYRYNTSARKYEALAMDTIPASVALDGIPTAPTARSGTNTNQIATTAFVQNELAQLREQAEAVTPVYYDGKTKAKLSLLGENGTIVTNIANGKVEQGSSDAVTGGQLWAAQRDMANMSALAARNIAANAAEITLLKKASATGIEGTNVNVSLNETDTNRIFTLSVPTTGKVAEGNTGIVSGGDIYKAINAAKKPVEAGSGIVIQDGIVSVDETIATKEDLEHIALANTFKIINGDHTAAMLGEAEGQPTYAINVRANGSIQKNDGRIVTGNTVYRETRLDQNGHIVQENNTAAQNLKALDNALFSIKDQLDEIPDTAALEQDLENLKARTDTLENAYTTVGSTYLDKDLTRLSNKGLQTIRTLAREGTLKIINGDHTTATLGEENGVPTYAINVRATGVVQERDGRVLTGQTVYKEVRPSEDGTVITVSDTTGNNLSALDAAYTGLRDRISDLEENVTVYTPGKYLSISDANVISVNVSGKVAEGNQGLVTGGQIIDAIQDSEAKTGLIIKDVHDELSRRINRFEDLEYKAGNGIIIEEEVISVDSDFIKQVAPAIYNSADSFPKVGDAEKLYVDADTNSLYRWDTKTKKYKEIQGNTINDCVTGIERDGDQLQITRADSSVTSVPLHSPLTNEEIDALF